MGDTACQIREGAELALELADQLQGTTADRALPRAPKGANILRDSQPFGTLLYLAFLWEPHIKPRSVNFGWELNGRPAALGR